MKIFITSDQHFHHGRIISFFNRPFRNVTEMNEVMIAKWNNKVKHGDVVFHLGDFSSAWNWKSIRDIRERLNGEIIIILGNHDKAGRLERAGFSIADSYIVKINNLLLTHKPLRKIRNNGSVNVHGHIHNQRTWGRRLNLSVEQTNYEPVELKDVMWMAKKVMEREKYGTV